MVNAMKKKSKYLFNKLGLYTAFSYLPKIMRKKFDYLKRNWKVTDNVRISARLTISPFRPQKVNCRKYRIALNIVTQDLREKINLTKSSVHWDIRITKTTISLNTEVFRKKDSFTEVSFKLDSFLSDRHTFKLVHCLMNQAHQICSNLKTHSLAF